jgi:peptide methionine sulfoxide reductase msrA/msrB
MNEIFFAGGCFWGTQHLFKQLRGVVATEAGYANGVVDNPTYEQVYTDTTGYAECVRVVYDPRAISLEQLLELYFSSIDPLSLNAQGGDVGTRYRTGIYYTDESDRATIEPVYRAVECKVGGAIVVELEPLGNFYPAEEYHQDYLDKNPAGYCHLPYYLFEYARKANK